MFEKFSGDRVWIEEQDHKYYIVHLDFGVDVEPDPNGAQWVLVRSDSPLYDSWRKRGKGRLRRFIAAFERRGRVNIRPQSGMRRVHVSCGGRRWLREREAVYFNSRSAVDQESRYDDGH